MSEITSALQAKAVTLAMWLVVSDPGLKAEYEAGVVKKMTYDIGERVSVVSFGSWYQGTVKKLGRTKVHVEYTTGSGATRTKAFDPSGDRITKDLTKSGRLPFRQRGAVER
ncbi:MAG: hypothetical protein ACYTG5_13465 [Planctomycetota bacterium]